MKQLSVETGVSVNFPGTYPTAGIKSTAGRVWSATTSFVSKSIKAAQAARMASVLEGMTNAQLAGIGITSRCQIWNHAEKLTSYRCDRELSIGSRSSQRRYNTHVNG